MDLAGFSIISVEQISFWGGNHLSETKLYIERHYPELNCYAFLKIRGVWLKVVVFGAGIYLINTLVGLDHAGVVFLTWRGEANLNQPSVSGKKDHLWDFKSLPKCCPGDFNFLNSILCFYFLVHLQVALEVHLQTCALPCPDPLLPC